MAVQLNSDKENSEKGLQFDDWILHHDNGPAHKALSVKLFLAKKKKKSITEMIWLQVTCGYFQKEILP
jgi:hypothetical protein